jgi:tRNA 2-thiouridine synthesizing protein E
MGILDSLKFDAEGFMENADAWTKEIAVAVALLNGMTLTERHWVVIDFARDHFKKTGESPTPRNITKGTDVTTKELYELFPGGPGKLVAKVSGLPKPHGCI